MKKAFTLIELLVVIVLMAIIAGMTVPAFIGMGRGATMRGSIRSISSTLSLCRQWAITHREKVIFHWYVDNGTGSCYYVENEFGIVITKTNDIPNDVMFIIDHGASDKITFKTTGELEIPVSDLNVTSEGDKYIKIADRKDVVAGRDIFKTIIVNWLTGGITVQ